jgi:signal transduction histidine kinase
MKKPDLLMQRFWERPALAWAGVLAIVALLVLLASLQYQWIGQLSEAERERLAKDLHAAADRFADEFNREMGRAMQLPAGPRPVTDDDEFARRLRYRLDSFVLSGLVKAVYVTRDGENGAEKIFQLQHDVFKESAWPPEMEELRKRLERRREPRPGFPGPFLLIDDSLPAFASVRGRRFPGPPFGPMPGLRDSSGPAVGGWTICVLDAEFLRKTYLPALEKTHFGVHYRMVVRRIQEPGQIIYSSATASAFSAANADARAELFRPRLRPPFARPEGGPGQIATAGWEVLVKHEAGSLEALVSRTRRRNLGISLAIMLMLVATLAILLGAIRRAQRLAQQQMEFVAGVSHELQTPLSVICSAGENLADGLVGAQDQVRRYGSVIRDEGRRLSNMVEQILRFAGIQSGRAQYRSELFSIDSLVEQALAASEAELREFNCQLERRIEPDLPLVLGDVTALAHAIRNLISNAAKHGAGSWVGFSAAAPGGEADPVIEIQVQDRGAGIDPEDMEYLFEPFFRGRRALADQVEGAGLGLTLAKRVIEAHGGTISVRSAPGEGTTFIVRLPAVLQQEHASSHIGG